MAGRHSPQLPALRLLHCTAMLRCRLARGNSPHGRWKQAVRVTLVWLADGVCVRTNASTPDGQGRLQRRFVLPGRLSQSHVRASRGTRRRGRRHMQHARLASHAAGKARLALRNASGAVAAASHRLRETDCALDAGGRGGRRRLCRRSAHWACTWACPHCSSQQPQRTLRHRPPRRAAHTTTSSSSSASARSARLLWPGQAAFRESCAQKAHGILQRLPWPRPKRRQKAAANLLQRPATGLHRPPRPHPTACSRLLRACVAPPNSLSPRPSPRPAELSQQPAASHPPASPLPPHAAPRGLDVTAHLLTSHKSSSALRGSTVLVLADRQ